MKTDSFNDFADQSALLATDAPYTANQVLANLKEMARTDDLFWINSVAADIVRRGIEDSRAALGLANVPDPALAVKVARGCLLSLKIAGERLRDPAIQEEAYRAIKLLGLQP